MELWIRSQSRQNLMKANDIVVKYNKILVFKDDDTPTVVGEYATKERALEVLDEIEELIKPQFKINYEYDDSQPIMNGEWLKSLKAESKIEELSCYVYEMPQR